MRKRLLLLAAACCAAGLFVFAAPQKEELDPLKVAGDTHSLLYENQIVRVISAKVPPGKLEPKHSHPRSVTVYLADYTVEQKSFPEGRVSRGDRKFGTVSWSDPVVHEVKNAGKTPSHAIRVELKF